MPAPAWEDLDDFLITDDQGGFATTAVITLNATGQQLPAIAGIFEDQTLDTHTGEYMLDLANPRFICKAVDVLAVSKFDTALIDGTVYDVTDDPQNDGTGMATLKLAPLAPSE